MIMSPAALQARSEDFAAAPVCVGLFKFARSISEARSRGSEYAGGP
jgi:hypothetical protein